MACQLLEVQPGQNICDCCAAPGGKTFTLAEQMENTGLVYSFDLYKGRVGLIQQGADRLRLSNIQAQRRDASRPYEGLPPMDAVLRRALLWIWCHPPQAGNRYKPLASVRELPRLQLTILKRGSPGKTWRAAALCHLHLESSRKRGSGPALFRQTSGVEPAPFSLPGIDRLVEEPSHTLTMLPWGGSDGFFAARFRRKGDL